MPQDHAEANDSRTGQAGVHITYDVEEDGKAEAVELPFVLDVLADLSGEPAEPRPRLADRKFVYVDPENFDAVVAAYAPRLRFLAGNRLERNGAPLRVELRFRSLTDFEPESVARQLSGLLGLLQAGHAGAADQLDEILHAPAFQRLEASWRGLRFLLGSIDAGARVKVRVLDVTRQELLTDIREAAALDRTAIFQKVCEPYGVFGGEPAAVVIGDYEFSNAADDLELLDALAQTGASAHAPFIAAASPRMFGFGDFAELSGKRSLSRIFEGPAYAHWRSFRQSGQAAYAVLVLPRILLRLPYGVTTAPVKAFSYEETIADGGGGNLLWGNAAFALGVRLAEAFRLYHWCAAITGLEGGGLVTHLPAVRLLDSNGKAAMKGPTEILLDEIQQKGLFDCGFNCLVHGKGTDKVAFLGVTTCLRPKLYQEAAATTAARLATQLPYLLAASRFAHYLKAIVRDSSGRSRSREGWEQALNEWIRQYVVENDSASADVKATFPLRDARIEVQKAPDYQMGFLAKVSIRPHFQVADTGLALRLVVELPPPAR